MGQHRIRRTSGRVLMSAIALALPLGLAGCLPGLKDAPPPAPAGKAPIWAGAPTVKFASTPVIDGLGVRTGWITIVEIPKCTTADGGLVLTPTASVSNGSIAPLAGGYIWTRAVSGTPAVAASGAFAADCVHEGLAAHPVITGTAGALP